LPAQLAGEGSHVGQQVVLGDGARRSGVDVLDGYPGRHGHPPGLPSIIPPGVHRHWHASSPKFGGDRSHMDVLSAGVYST
jgi:hypothetical protein